MRLAELPEVNADCLGVVLMPTISATILDHLRTLRGDGRTLEEIL